MAEREGVCSRLTSGRKIPADTLRAIHLLDAQEIESAISTAISRQVPSRENEVFLCPRVGSGLGNDIGQLPAVLSLEWLLVTCLGTKVGRYKISAYRKIKRVGAPNNRCFSEKNIPRDLPTQASPLYTTPLASDAWVTPHKLDTSADRVVPARPATICTFTQEKSASGPEGVFLERFRAVHPISLHPEIPG